MKHQDNNIIQEIAEIAPILASIPKANLAVVPDHYFDQVEGEILSQLNLLNGDNQSQLALPSDYFGKVDEVIMDRIVDEDLGAMIIEMPSSKVNYLKYAAIVVFFAACIGLLRYAKPPKNTEVASQLTQTEVLDYMVENAEDFDINMLIDQELIDETTLDGLSYISIDDESLDYFESDF